VALLDLLMKIKRLLNIRTFKSYQDFGFGVLDRLDEFGLKWLFTEFDTNGKELFNCQISERTILCK
jgi:hypothetical protein